MLMDYKLMSVINGYIAEDSSSLIYSVNDKLNQHGISVTINSKIDKNFGEDYCDVSFTISSNDSESSFNASWTYGVDGDEVYIDINLDNYAKRIVRHFKDNVSSSEIMSSSRNHRQRIVGADEEFDDIDSEPYDDSGNVDEGDVNALSDTVEDLQDLLQDVEEDEVDIDVDANITNHYIAQCDGCHEVFISALTETNQKVEKVSGICPLCEKETDQYIYWIIRDVGTEDVNV